MNQPAPRELSDEQEMRCSHIAGMSVARVAACVIAMREGIAIGREEGAKVERALWELAAIGQEIERAESAAPAPETPRTTDAHKVGCERDDGLLNIHAETETCEVCAPRTMAAQPAALTNEEQDRLFAVVDRLEAAAVAKAGCPSSAEACQRYLDARHAWYQAIARPQSAIAREDALDAALRRSSRGEPWDAPDARTYADGVHEAAEVFYRMAGSGRTAIHNAIKALAASPVAQADAQWPAWNGCACSACMTYKEQLEAHIAAQADGATA